MSQDQIQNDQSRVPAPSQEAASTSPDIAQYLTRPKQQQQQDKVLVAHGANKEYYPLAGKKVGHVRKVLRHSFNLSKDATAMVNNQPVEDDFVLAPGQHLEFSKPSGVKGAKNTMRSKVAKAPKVKEISFMFRVRSARVDHENANIIIPIQLRGKYDDIWLNDMAAAIAAYNDSEEAATHSYCYAVVGPTFTNDNFHFPIAIEIRPDRQKFINQRMLDEQKRILVEISQDPNMRLNDRADQRKAHEELVHSARNRLFDIYGLRG